MKRKHKFALGASVVALSALGGVKAQAMSVQTIAEAAVPVANQYGLYPSVMIAQGLLESSHGASGLATNYNNIFGVKYTSGNPVYLPTQEYVNGKMITTVEAFQSYGSVYEACLAQARLLRGSLLYSGAWRENTSSYRDATAWLQGRYATDPNYAAKLNSLIAQYGLTAYDKSGAVASSVSSASSSQSRSASGTYTVQAGDTLSAIALKYGTTVSKLVAANGLVSADSIREGQVLKLSASAAATSSSAQTSSSSGTSSTGNYTVKAGDSLSSIAAKFGTTVKAILKTNALVSADSLQVGQRLQINVNAAGNTQTSSTRTYTVQNGDSLYSIARANGMTADQLAALNGLSLYQTIHPGQTLQL